MGKYHWLGTSCIGLARPTLVVPNRVEFKLLCWEDESIPRKISAFPN